MNRYLIAWMFLFLSLVVFASCRTAQAQDALTIDQLLDNMEKVRMTVKSFTADVTKLRDVDVLNDKEFYKGAIQFKAPRLLRMTLKSQETAKENVFVVGPKYGWIYRPQDKQAERVELPDLKDVKRKSGNPLEYGLARDVHGLKEGYALKLLPTEKVGDVAAAPIEMIPMKNNVNAAGKVVLWVSLQTWLPVQVREWKGNDEIIETHTFTNMQINVTLEDALFDFQPPKDVDVILHEGAK